MAALWLHTVSLLVLLVMSCPVSQAIASQHICGPHLVNALHLVCGERGFLYMPRGDNSPVQRFLHPMAARAASVGDENKVTEQEQMEIVVKRGIVEECCHRPCSLFDLENYCF
ncbi:insulin-like [Mastacembelus armatus]|uniref:Insulin n=1 Tax=Mastacembelus armatus TaxID=205130 RepID=A0A7N8WMJ5_9TELE|nr:insulin-like [Mastacembelus armatus]XP_026184473.1 insulin-like [Mastacembelus armatus]